MLPYLIACHLHRHPMRKTCSGLWLTPPSDPCLLPHSPAVRHLPATVEAQPRARGEGKGLAVLPQVARVHTRPHTSHTISPCRCRRTRCLRHRCRWHRHPCCCRACLGCCWHPPAAPPAPPDPHGLPFGARGRCGVGNILYVACSAAAISTCRRRLGCCSLDGVLNRQQGGAQVQAIGGLCS